MKEYLIRTGAYLLLIATGVLIGWSGLLDALRLINFDFFLTLVPITSASFGALIAAYLLTKREEIQAEKEKIQIINKWILYADHARFSLDSIKSSYQGKLENDPRQRLESMSFIVNSPVHINSEYSDLSFIVPREGATDISKWSKIPRIRMMFESYNYLFSILNKRNELIHLSQKEHAKRNTNNVHATDPYKTYKDFCNVIGTNKTETLIDLNEQVIKHIDDTLIQLNEFLHLFPAYARTVINTEIAKYHSRIISFSENVEGTTNRTLERCPVLDYETTAKLLGEELTEIRNRFSPKQNK